MKFQTKDLTAALSQLAGAVPRSSSLPILGHVLIKGRGDLVRITGSDMQQQVEVDVPAEDADGDLTINYARLVAAAKQTDADTITLGTMGAGGQISVSAGKSRYRLSAFPPADWPAWPEHPRQSADINAAALSGMLAHCAPAAATNDPRPYLNGIFLDHADGNLYAVATDGHRLHVASMPLAATGSLTAIIPIAAVASARACLADSAADIRFGAGEYDCELAGVWGNWRAKVLEGRYPEWRRMMPKTEFTCTVAQKDLAAVLARVLGLKKGKYMGAKLTFCQEILMISGTNEEREAIEDEVSATCDGAHTVTVNAEYLYDAIASLKNLMVTIRFAPDDNIPLFVEPQDSGLAYAQYAVVMPIKV